MRKSVQFNAWIRWIKYKSSSINEFKLIREMKGNSQSKEVLNNLRGKGKDFENYETKQLIIKIAIVYFSKTSSNSDKLIKRWDIMSVIFGSFQSDLDWPPPKRTSQRKASWREVWWTLHAVEIPKHFWWESPIWKDWNIGRNIQDRFRFPNELQEDSTSPNLTTGTPEIKVQQKSGMIQ